MSKIEDFKLFVKKNPELINYVKEKKNTWQGFYELYDLYGEDENVWKEYLNKSNVNLDFLKNINLEGLQSGINSIQKMIELLQEFTSKDKSDVKEEYKPRPIYKHFED